MAEEYQPSIFEKMAPFIEDYNLACLKLQQLKAKRIAYILPDHVQELENAKDEAKERVFEIIHQDGVSW